MLFTFETTSPDLTDVRESRQPRVFIGDIAENSIVYLNASTDVTHDPSGRVLFIFQMGFMLQSATQPESTRKSRRSNVYIRFRSDLERCVWEAWHCTIGIQIPIDHSEFPARRSKLVFLSVRVTQISKAPSSGYCFKSKLVLRNQLLDFAVGVSTIDFMTYGWSYCQ
jgi:hypothetical protein